MNTKKVQVWVSVSRPASTWYIVPNVIGYETGHNVKSSLNQHIYIRNGNNVDPTMNGDYFKTIGL